MPMVPATWSAAVLSVMDVSQEPGSLVPSRHTLARMVVGPVPVHCRRIQNQVSSTWVSREISRSKPLLLMVVWFEESLRTMFR